MLKIGITGGIGSGKSLVCKVFSKLGVPIFNSDEVAKYIINTDPEVWSDLASYFGKEIYNKNKKKRNRY